MLKRLRVYARFYVACPGINIPLAFVGQEWLWVQIFAGYGIPFEDQASFYSGPAFLPWFRMGNMRGWGGPITMGWLETRKALNIQVGHAPLTRTPLPPLFSPPPSLHPALSLKREFSCMVGWRSCCCASPFHAGRRPVFAISTQMLARMRGLGMTPALSAFAGHVPKA